MVLCLVSNLFIPISQTCAITSTLEFGVHRESNFQSLIPVKTGKPGISPGEWLFSDPAEDWKRDAWQTDLGLRLWHKNSGEFLLSS